MSPGCGPLPCGSNRNTSIGLDLTVMVSMPWAMGRSSRYEQAECCGVYCGDRRSVHVNLRRRALIPSTETFKEAVARIAAALLKALADPAVIERLSNAALDSVGGSSKEFARRIQSEIATRPRAAKELKLGQQP